MEESSEEEPLHGMAQRHQLSEPDGETHTGTATHSQNFGPNPACAGEALQCVPDVLVSCWQRATSARLSAGRSVYHRNSPFPVPPRGVVGEAGQEGAVALPFPVSCLLPSTFPVM